MNLSTSLGKLIAVHWRSGEPTDGSLKPDRLFIIFCETDDHRYQLIKGLQQLNALQTNVDAAHNSSCTRNRSLRLGQHSGVFAPYPDDETHPDEASLGHAASFQVLEETPSRQVVEVRYNDGMTDIDDAMFRYAVENGTVTPLESRVLVRVMVGMFGEFVLLILVTLLIVGTGGVVRRYRRRRNLKMKAGQPEP